jgi:hypothetical protein
MPFGASNTPSIALVQLKSALDRHLKGQVSVETFYVNQDFTHYMGAKIYKHLTTSMTHHSSGWVIGFSGKQHFRSSLTTLRSISALLLFSGRSHRKV